jgi:hypothetical protein
VSKKRQKSRFIISAPQADRCRALRGAFARTEAERRMKAFGRLRPVKLSPNAARPDSVKQETS